IIAAGDGRSRGGSSGMAHTSAKGRAHSSRPIDDLTGEGPCSRSTENLVHRRKTVKSRKSGNTRYRSQSRSDSTAAWSDSDVTLLSRNRFTRTARGRSDGPLPGGLETKM